MQITFYFDQLPLGGLGFMCQRFNFEAHLWSALSPAVFCPFGQNGCLTCLRTGLISSNPFRTLLLTTTSLEIKRQK